MLRKLMALFDLSQGAADMLFGWANVILIFGAALVLVGTIGAIWTGGIRERYAGERLSGNEVKTAKAIAAASEANERTAEFQVQSKQAQLDLERERVARLKLEEKLRPRSISEEERRQLLATLKSEAKGRVFVIPKTFDEEAEEYASQISNVLQEAGYTIEPWTNQRPFSFGRSGVFIWVKDFAKPPPHAGGIQHAFKEIGITLDGYGDANLVPDMESVIIAVAVKDRIDHPKP
jgi:hypothetical protein